MAGPHLPVPAGIYSGAIRSIPKEWDHVWFRRFLTDFAQKADTRNAIAGPGVSITGPGATKPSQRAPAVISANMGTMPIFTATTPGIVPASGGGTVNFLRADGSWVAIITSPVVWTLTATDRLAAVNAGSGQTGNRVILAGANAGQNTQIDDIIALGSAAFSAGTALSPITVTGLVGSVVIGSQSLKALTASSSGGGTPPNAPLTVIGYNVAPTATDLNASVIVGSNILSGWGANLGTQSVADNVLLGDAVGQAITPGTGSNGYFANVMIGRQAGSGNTGGGAQVKTVSRNVILGNIAVNGLFGNAGTGGPGFDRNVVIGYAAGQLAGSIDNSNGCQKNIIIGASADAPSASAENVVIGYQAKANTGSSSGSLYNVCIGSNALCAGSANVLIGAYTVGSNNGNRLVIIGGGANPGRNASDLFLIETNDGVASRRSMFFGVMCDGVTQGTGAIFGLSTEGVNRDIQGINSFKFLNGAAGAGAPLGGGYFYSSAGNLHWVDTNGVDTQLTPTAGRQSSAPIYMIENTDVWDETTYVLKP